MSFIVPQGDINMRITAILVFLFMLGCTYSPQLPNVTNAQGTSATGKISQREISANKGPKLTAVPRPIKRWKNAKARNESKIQAQT